jgi:phosphoribosylamine---glycine ligase
MNILIIDAGANALDFAIRCQDAGHSVRLFIKPISDGTEYQVGDNLVPKIKNWQSAMDWADLVFVTDNTCYLKQLDGYRKRGYPVFCSSSEGAELELDRDKGQKLFESLGMAVAPSKEFSDYRKAEEYVRSTGGIYVSKPSGDADKALTYCSKGPDDMIFMLRHWKKLGKIKSPFILQEFKSGTEMAVGGWFGPMGFSKWFLENWEFKKLMNDDKGPATGEQGTTMRYTVKSKLADEVLKPLESALLDLDYVGYIDVNCIIDDDGTPWPLEFTCRPGWPTFQIQQALHKGDPAAWMLDLINGNDTLKVSTDVACGVVVSQPPYPFNVNPTKESIGVPVYGMDDPKIIDHIHPAEMMLGICPVQDGNEIVDRAMLVSAGTYMVIVSGTGETVSKASKASYKTIDKLRFINSPQYRTDIGDRLKDQIDTLHGNGYALGMDY